MKAIAVVCKAGREPLKNKTAVSSHTAAARWLQSFRSSTSGRKSEPKLKNIPDVLFWTMSHFMFSSRMGEG